MTEKPDPFGFDISVSSAKKNKPRTRRGMSGESETSRRLCDHEGCENAGKFRAPKAPDVLDDFLWFCKDHVREYNQKWNFFQNQTEAELNAQMSKDKVWERETKSWRDPESRAWARLGIEDPHQVLGENATTGSVDKSFSKKYVIISETEGCESNCARKAGINF